MQRACTKREGLSNACDSCGALRRPARCPSAHKAAQCRRLAKVRQQSGAGPPRGARTIAASGTHSSGRADGRSEYSSTPRGERAHGCSPCASTPRGGGHPTWIGTSALRASSRMTKPVTEFVAYLSAGTGPAVGRYDPRRTGRTAGAKDSWRGRPAESLQLAVNDGRRQVYKTAPRGHEEGGRAEKARCEGGVLRAGWLRVRAAGCRSS